MKRPSGQAAHEGARPSWRPIPAWRWMLAAAAAVVITAVVVIIWLYAIAGHAKPGTDQANARLDAVRTGLAAGAGAGAAVGLMLAFRRQHHQEIATDLSDRDATEWRITELYAKAVEQLGNDKAPVRLGGLYALERLAQDNREHRQTIVNVVCAYLRMPFSPTPPARKPEPEVAEDPREGGTRPETTTDGNGDTWHQERQVRRTAQRILADHLRDDRTEQQRSTDPPSQRFWPGIRLDLAGATLIDFDIKNGLLADASFLGATFSGIADFRAATFSGTASFLGASFSGTASFLGTSFSNTASFLGATFSGIALFDRTSFSTIADFSGATFSGNAGFKEATFSGEAAFSGATLNSDAGFTEVTFSRDAMFDNATFRGRAEFSRATFSGHADFHKSIFKKVAVFSGVTFSDSAVFGGAAFSSHTDFHGAIFNEVAGFVRAIFSESAGFDDVTFRRDVMFDDATFSDGELLLSFERSCVLSSRPKAKHVWPAGWCLGPDGSGGYTVVRATDAGRS